VLLAAFDACRPTNDVDLAGLDLADDTGAVLQLLRSVLVVEPSMQDGIGFVAESLTAQGLLASEMTSYRIAASAPPSTKSLRR
jgi:hypothetical protein